MIYKKCLFLFFNILIFQFVIFSQNVNFHYSNKLEEKLFRTLIKQHQIEFDTLSTWLIAQGIDSIQEINITKDLYNSVLEKIKKDIEKDDDFEDLAEDIFYWMHDNLLKKYDNDGKISDLLSDGKYNIISSNTIYYLLCISYNIPITLINNPYYIKTKIEFSNDSIEVDIVDKKMDLMSMKIKISILKI